MSGVQSIERAFALLRALAVGPAGVTELADRADLPKSTVARLLAALETEGAVEQVETGGEYRLGDTLADLAGAAAPGYNLVTAARPHLQELTNLTGETSGLAILDDDAVYYLDHVEAEEEVMVRSWTGERIPLHLVPSGLALLSGVSVSCVDRYVTRDLERATDHSVVTPATIRQRVQEVRSRGYLWFHQEFDESICSVAAPVRRGDGTVIAAIHVHGPAFRFPGDSDQGEIGQLVRQTAERLAGQLH
ncbi:MAG: IclR family transcriptional regulator [Actinomycetia bacterium]|nr:IclR family transcriptional regulator [Actinomycetes bacterium]MCP4222501.1 IclR family transcriptional regulator [Actinomycetes bacterium]MCP5031341.1 IclR family transcriptional regulator [Actinomycetes bacterium]